MRKVLGIVAALAAVSTGVVVGATSSAWACSCVAGSEQEYFAQADVVFTGTVIDSDDPLAGESVSSGDPIEYTVDVDGTQKGSVGDPAVVRSARSGATCGVSFTVGRRYQIFAQKHEGRWWASLCSGTQDLGEGSIVVTSPTPSPHRSPSVRPAAPSTSPTVTVSPSPVASPTTSMFVLIGPPFVADPNRGKPLAGSVAGFAAAAALGALVWTLRDRRNA